MKKILVVLILLLTGCNVNHEVVINSDKSVSEKITVKVDSNTFTQEFPSVDIYIEEQKQHYDTHELYDIEIEEIDDYTYVYFKRNYNSLTEYFASESFQTVFKTANIKNISKEYHILTSENLYFIPNSFGISGASHEIYESFNYTIKTDLEIIDSNASNKEINSHTWDLTKHDDTLFINIDYSSTSINQLLILGGVVAFIIVLVLIHIFIKNKSNNKI